MTAPRIRTAAALLLLLLPAPHARGAEGILKKATYCLELEESQEPKNPVESFPQDAKVCLSVELKGRPKSGIALARFFFRDSLIAEGKVDVATVNKGVIFSVGQSTFVGFRLTPKAPLPVGEGFRTDVSFDGKPLGSFPFRVEPPKGAIPSKVTATTLARKVDDNNAPVGETRNFTVADKVVLAGRGDFGLGSWLEANWIVSGKIDEAGTKSFTLEENKSEVPFYFSYVPKGGWPEGEHAVALIMNGREVAREKFTIKAGPMATGGKIVVSRTALFKDDGKGAAGEETNSFSPSDRVLHVKFGLEEAAAAQGASIAWILVEAADMKNQQIASATIEEAGPQRVLTGSLSLKRDLPAGTYRVELRQGDDLLAAKDFRVGAAPAAAEPPVGGGLRGRRK